ncbi:hypothetical protein BLA29_001256, partial [Euroglyphus maynei]
MLPKQQQQQTNSNMNNQLSSPSTTATTRITKCAQLQIPGQESSSSLKRISPSPSFIMTNDNSNDGNQVMKTTAAANMNDLKDFFDDNCNEDKLKCYAQIIDGYRWIRMKSFSTADIMTMSGQLWDNNTNQLSSSWWCSSPPPSSSSM